MFPGQVCRRCSLVDRREKENVWGKQMHIQTVEIEGVGLGVEPRSLASTPLRTLVDRYNLSARESWPYLVQLENPSPISRQRKADLTISSQTVVRCRCKLETHHIELVRLPTNHGLISQPCVASCAVVPSVGKFEVPLIEEKNKSVAPEPCGSDIQNYLFML